jgi:hypothetical protein
MAITRHERWRPSLETIADVNELGAGGNGKQWQQQGAAGAARGRAAIGISAQASLQPHGGSIHRFAALADEPDETIDMVSALGRPPVSRGVGGRVLRRVAAELINWDKSRRGQLPAEPPEYADQANRAEDFKLLIYEFCDPSTGGDISVPVPKIPFRPWARDAFWDQIAISRLRFQGAKGTYAVCKAARQRRRRRIDDNGSPPLPPQRSHPIDEPAGVKAENGKSEPASPVDAGPLSTRLQSALGPPRHHQLMPG